MAKFLRRRTAPRRSEEFILATLSPVERWRYLLKNNKPEAIVVAIGFFGGVFMTITAFTHLFPGLAK